MSADTRVALVWLAFCAVLTLVALVRLWQEDRHRNPYAFSPDTEQSRAELHANAAKTRAMRGGGRDE
jgi:hypothetical protein